MNSILGLSESEAAAPAKEPTLTSRQVAKRLAAALLSGIVPGAGQILYGRMRAAALFLGGFAAAAALFWPLRLPHLYLGLGFSVLVLAALSIASAWHVARFSDAKSHGLRRWWLLLVVLIACVGVSFDSNAALRFAGFQVFSIPTSSMENTLIVGDRVVVDRWYYEQHRPEMGDIAVFRREGNWEVKRILALGGDTIYGRSDLVYRNGQLLREPYVIHLYGLHDSFPNTVNFGPVTLTPGQLFVMGDNRDVSYDSRQPQHGPISLSSGSGKPLYIIRSPDRRRVGTTLR